MEYPEFQTGKFGRMESALAFHIPKEVLEMFVENKFSINAMARMLEVSESTVKRRLCSFGISIFLQNMLTGVFAKQ